MYQALAKVQGFKSSSSKWPQEVSSVNNPILQMSTGTLMQSEVPWVYPATKWQGWDMNPGSLVPVSVFLTTVLCRIHSAVFSKVIIESLTLKSDSCNLGWFGCTPIEKHRHYVQVLLSPRHTHSTCVSGTSYIHLGRESESNLYGNITLI